MAATKDKHDKAFETLETAVRYLYATQRGDDGTIEAIDIIFRSMGRVPVVSSKSFMVRL